MPTATVSWSVMCNSTLVWSKHWSENTFLVREERSLAREMATVRMTKILWKIKKEEGQ
jgi:hypothetical protein